MSSSRDYTPPPTGSLKWIAERGSAPKGARVPRAAERRRAGMVLGAAAGLVYGAASHAINLYLLPGVPLYLPPLGPAGNTLLLGLAGGLIGLAAAWPGASLNGAMAGCLAGIAALEARAWLTGVGTPLLRQMLSARALFVPIAAAVAMAVMVPFGLLLRWAVDEAVERLDTPGWAWARLRAVQGLLLLALGLGLWAYYPADVRVALRQMDGMLARAVTAVDDSQLPAPLRGAAVPGFVGSATPEYRLAWGEVSEGGEPLGVTGGDTPSLSTSQITLTARFANGYQVVCVYANVEYEPRCRGR